MKEMGSTEEISTQNVISLFARSIQAPLYTEFEEILEEEVIEGELIEGIVAGPLKDVQTVSAGDDPLKSIFILKNQIIQLKETVQKMRFYLSDLQDVLPKSSK
jgi:hypothetical protein